jgi:hypothetical protein
MTRVSPATQQRAVRTPGPPPKAEVLGVPLAVTDYERTLDWIDAGVAAGQRG